MRCLQLRDGLDDAALACFRSGPLVQFERIHMKGEIRAGSTGGQIAFIDTRDIGGVAACCVHRGRSREKTYHLTGGAVLAYGRLVP